MKSLYKIGFYIGCKKQVNQGKILVESIKNSLKVEIYIIIPKTLETQINIENVNIMKAEIPFGLRNIPFVDKIFAASVFEEICKEKYIWIDVDSYIFKSFRIPNENGIHVNPVDKKNIGDEYGKKRSQIWSFTYNYMKINENKKFVKTTISNERIFPYYNVGMVVINNKKELFNNTIMSIEKLLNDSLIKELLEKSFLNKIFFHQVVFSCCLIKAYRNEIGKLPKGLNYPLHLHSQNPNSVNLNDIISIRYDDYFDNNLPPDEWKDIFNPIKNDLKSCWYY